MNSELKKPNFREEVANMFVQSLEEDPIEFVRGWNFSSVAPENGLTGKKYRGVNLVYLSLLRMKKGYTDCRWMTFNQIKEKGYRLKEGSKGAKVEYWMPYDLEKKTCVSWKEYEKRYKENPEEIAKKYTIRARYYTVFNGDLINGLEPRATDYEKHNIDEDELIESISKSLDVPIIEVNNSSKAYYSPAKDEIVLPKREQFLSKGDYISTALHELAHSTGHKTRLNRNQNDFFGTEGYAFEELIAEITSAMMGEYVDEPITEHMINQHKAYVQSWAAEIKEDKNFLFKAIKEAENATDYIIEKAHLVELLEKEKVERNREEELEM